MATDIDSLDRVEIDFTAAGPGYKLGYHLAEDALARSRDGFLRIDARFPNGTVPVLMRRDDLYVLGFRAGNTWWRFSDAAWPLTPAATSLGHDGQYDSLGGLSGDLTADAIRGCGKLGDVKNRHQWRESLRALLVVVAESLRLVPVQMQVLGLLNGVLPSVPLASLERYVKNWGKASKGTDMSVDRGEGLRTGFGDPTNIRR